MEFLSWVRDQWDRVGAVVLVVVGALALLLGFYFCAISHGIAGAENDDIACLEATYDLSRCAKIATERDGAEVRDVIAVDDDGLRSGGADD